MTRPSRRQHFIARFYLRNFAEPMFSDKLLVYTRQAGCWEDRTPNGIGWFPHLHSVISNAGKRTDEFDQFFKRHVEDPAAPALKKMAEGQCVNACERSVIAFFIALTAARSPDLLDATRNEYLKGTSDKERERTQHLIEIWAQMTGQHCVSFKDFLKRSQLGAIWVWARSMQDRLLKWQWHILNTTRDRPFVTSDRPVYAECDRNQDVRLVSFPVSSTVALLVISDDQIRERLNDEQDVSVLNRQTMHRATDFLVACQRDFPGREFLKKWPQCS